MTLVEDLKWRGLIKDISSLELEEKLNKGGMTFYIGTDPTADSLHVGHLSSFLISKRLKDAGHHPILLVGGGTGMIGDPKPTTERAMISKEEVRKNFEALKKQVEDLISKINKIKEQFNILKSKNIDVKYLEINNLVLVDDIYKYKEMVDSISDISKYQDKYKKLEVFIETNLLLDNLQKSIKSLENKNIEKMETYNINRQELEKKKHELFNHENEISPSH